MGLSKGKAKERWITKLRCDQKHNQHVWMHSKVCHVIEYDFKSRKKKGDVPRHDRYTFRLNRYKYWWQIRDKSVFSCAASE